MPDDVWYPEVFEVCCHSAGRESVLGNHEHEACWERCGTHSFVHFVFYFKLSVLWI